jgi:glutamine amidotransferase
MIVIVDYGMGNLGSVLNMLKKINVEAKITSNLDEIYKANKILLPGVGSFDNAMQKISNLGMKDILNHKALKEKIPILGICLGMQLLTNKSEEGKLEGLGWITGEVLSFKGKINDKFKIPHMGWNTTISVLKSDLNLNIDQINKYYFVHSYFVKALDEKNVLMTTNYGINFHSAIVKDNIFGVQFHPEKSHQFGMNLLEKFSKI